MNGVHDMKNNRKRVASKLAWGLFWLLIAALILANYFGGFVQLGAWSVIIAAIAFAILVYCIATLSIASVPIPLAALYYIFQTPLELPYMSFWMMVLVTLLLTCGLHVLLPRKLRSVGAFKVSFDGDSVRRGGGRHDADEGGVLVEEGEDENNPYIRVKFGHVCRYLHSECLESAQLECSCGAMEVFFDHVQLSPDGAEIYVKCSLGSLELYVPSHWNVINNMNASLGNADVGKRREPIDEDAPIITINGGVTLGNVEVHRIRC